MMLVYYMMCSFYMILNLDILAGQYHLQEGKSTSCVAIVLAHLQAKFQREHFILPGFLHLVDQVWTVLWPAKHRQPNYT